VEGELTRARGEGQKSAETRRDAELQARNPKKVTFPLAHTPRPEPRNPI